MSDHNLVFEQFDSLGEYISIIGKRKVNKVFYGCIEQRSEDDDCDFRGTHSYEESVELALNGYKDGCNSLMKASKRVQHCENVNRKMPIIDITGFAPHVPNAITGVPKSMISHLPYQQKAKVLTLVYANADSADVDADQFIEAGRSILNLINTLETQGYRIALYSTVVCSCRSEKVAMIVKIKDWKQPLNMLKIAYPMAHPSFLRRQFFKWLETLPELTDSGFKFGYGKPIHKEIGSYEDRVKFLREKGVLKNNWFYIERPQAEENDVDGLISLLGIDVAGKRKVA